MSMPKVLLTALILLDDTRGASLRYKVPWRDQWGSDCTKRTRTALALAPPSHRPRPRTALAPPSHRPRIARSHQLCVMGSAAPDDVQAETSPSAILLHFAHFAHFSSFLGLRCELDFSLDPEFHTIQTPIFLRRCQPDRLLPDKHHNPSRPSLGELTPGPTIQGSFPIPSGFYSPEICPRRILIQVCKIARLVDSNGTSGCRYHTTQVQGISTNSTIH
ncbi:hypothetical protein E2P81_ATG11497 [Venturia nashicola]|nr:hypothetical protein E2P81_ATG11497 [Venturia nashicola]